MTTYASVTRTQVVIVGGPAGLMLSHLLHQCGIDSVVLERRSGEAIATTHRAGILECDSVRLLTESGSAIAFCAKPCVTHTDGTGVRHEVLAMIVVKADGSRKSLPRPRRRPRAISARLSVCLVRGAGRGASKRARTHLVPAPTAGSLWSANARRPFSGCSSTAT